MLFFVNHITDGLDGFFQRCYRFLRVGSGKCLPGLLKARTNIVMNGPHHLGRSAEMVRFQHGKELIFFTGIMNIDVA